SAHLQTSEACGKPSLLFESLGAGEGDIRPPSRLSNRDQTLDNLGVLTRRGEALSVIRECASPVREVKLVTHLDESLADLLRHNIAPFGERSPVALLTVTIRVSEVARGRGLWHAPDTRTNGIDRCS